MSFDENKKAYTSIFYLYNIVKQVEFVSITKILILAIIECLQILYFCFSKIFENVWDSRLESLFKIIRYFNYGFILEDIDKNFFRIFFFIEQGLFVVFILSFVLLFISLKTNSFSKFYTILVSNTICLFNHVFVIPITGIYLRILYCANMVPIIKGYVCFKDSHIFYYTFALVMIIILIVFSLLNSKFLVNFTPSSKNYTGKICDSNYEVYFALKRILLVILFTYKEPFGKYSLWMLGIILFIVHLVEFLYLLFFNPYFSNLYYKILLATRSIWLYFSLIIMISIFTNKTFTGELVMFLLGLISIIMFFFVFKEDKLQKYLESTVKINSSIALKRLFYLTELFSSNNEVENYTLARALIIIQELNDTTEINLTKANLSALIDKIEESNIVTTSNIFN